MKIWKILLILIFTIHFSIIILCNWVPSITYFSFFNKGWGMFTNTYMWLGQKVYVRGIDENGKTTEWLNISQSITDEIKKNRFSPAIFQREVFTHAVGTAMERYDYRKTIHSNDEYVLAMERIVEDYLKTEYGGKTFKHIDIKIVNKSLQSSKKIEVFIPIEVKK